MVAPRSESSCSTVRGRTCVYSRGRSAAPVSDAHTRTLLAPAKNILGFGESKSRVKPRSFSLDVTVANRNLFDPSFEGGPELSRISEHHPVLSFQAQMWSFVWSDAAYPATHRSERSSVRKHPLSCGDHPCTGD